MGSPSPHGANGHFLAAVDVLALDEADERPARGGGGSRP